MTATLRVGIFVALKIKNLQNNFFCAVFFAMRTIIRIISWAVIYCNKNKLIMVEILIPRVCGRQTHRLNINSKNPETYFKVSVLLFIYPIAILSSPCNFLLVSTVIVLFCAWTAGRQNGVGVQRDVSFRVKFSTHGSDSVVEWIVKYCFLCETVTTSMIGKLHENGWFHGIFTSRAHLTETV